MDSSAWIGLALGGAIGLLYGLWQAWDLRSGSAATPSISRMLLATVRIALLMGSLLAAYKYTRAAKVWLAGGTALGFSVVLGWRLKTRLSNKK